MANGNGDIPHSAENRYYALTESAADAIISANGAGEIVGWNRAAERIFGYSKFEAIGRPLTLIMPARYIDQHLAGMARVHGGGAKNAIGRTVELYGLTKTGSEFPIELSLSQWESPDGPFYTGIVRDISERRRMEALRESEKKYRGIYESLHDVYVESALDGTILEISPQIENLSRGQYKREDLLGKFTNMLYADPEQRETLLLELRKHGSVKDFEAVLKCRDGSLIPCSISAIIQVSTDGRPNRIAATFRDITDRKVAENEIKRYLNQLESGFMHTVEVAMTLSEMRDPYTAGHERRVASIAVEMGKVLGWDEHQLDGLKVAGHLHDIGKIMIPAEILSKPSKLNTAEFELVKMHPRGSYEVLKDVEFPWPVADPVLQHHERLDGSGYPQGLAGDEICPMARILSVADVVEAMASHRPYRAGLGMDAALSEIKRGRGTVFDANVVDACLHVFLEKNYNIPS